MAGPRHKPKAGGNVGKQLGDNCPKNNLQRHIQIFASIGIRISLHILLPGGSDKIVPEHLSHLFIGVACRLWMGTAFAPKTLIML